MSFLLVIATPCSPSMIWSTCGSRGQHGFRAVDGVEMQSLVIRPSYKNSLLCQRTFRSSLSARSSHGSEEKEPHSVPAKKDIPPMIDELSDRFNELFHFPTEEDDLGVERMERLTRKKMKRIPVFREDFCSLEENHILFGEMGTPNSPVLVESNMTTRIVGCQGSSKTRLHSVMWHLVKREKPCICLECGQVFQLVSPNPGEEIYPFVDAHH